MIQTAPLPPAIPRLFPFVQTDPLPLRQLESLGFRRAG
jgi:hypothetical protein